LANHEEETKKEAAHTPRGLRIGINRDLNPIEEIELSLQEMKGKLLAAQSFYNRVSTLTDIALQIDAARGRTEILQVLRNEIKWLVEFDVCFVGLLSRSHTSYSITTLSAIADSTELDGKTFQLNQGMPGWAIQNQSPILMDVSAGPAFTESIEGTLSDLGMKSLLVVPLRTSDETLGALTLSAATPGAYVEQDLWIAQLLAHMVAVALRNSDLFDDAKKRIAQIELVSEIAEKLTSTLELDELLNSAADLIRKNFNYFDVTIFLVHKPENDVVLVAHSGNYVDFLPHGYRQRMSDGIVGWVATHGERLLANDVTQEERYMAYEYHSTKSELAVPIIVEHEIVGVLNVEDTKVHAFDETDVIVLETLCGQIGSAIRKAKLYEEVKRANTKLTELDRMKSDFLGIVSHDFRSPLASIILAAKALLKRGEAVEPQRLTEYLTIIVDQADKLNHLAEDTLSIAKMESGQLSYFFKVVNVERLVKDAAALVNISRRHSVEHIVEEDVAYIRGDQAKLRQVIQNLLSNAVKYSPKGGIVRVRAQSHSEDEILISVSDEGIGIQYDQMDRLFQKFSRIDSAESREIKGSGLGLWICREIVQAHGGRIWAESEPGQGSTFFFTLKRALPEA
jgi:K+-sensing histidine kinase KdpD